MIVTKPSELPRLEDEPWLAIDAETHDPNLKELGPGCRRNDGYPVGWALATRDGRAWYLPVRHEQKPNLPEKAVRHYLSKLAANLQRRWCGANLSYDLDWLKWEGIELAGPVDDVLFAARLLDTQRYGLPNLDDTLEEHLGERKTGDELWTWLATHRGKGEPTRKAQIGFLKDAPPALVAEYACGDVAQLGALLAVLEKKLEARSALAWYRKEARLLKYVMRMRWRGIRVDVARAEELAEIFKERYAQKLEEFGEIVYPRVWKKYSMAEKLDALNANSAASLAAAYTKARLRFPVTKLGRPSFRKEWLREQDDPISKLVRELRALSKTQGTFFSGYVLQHQVQGRVHPLLNQLVPRTLRFSGEHPNPQNLPSRDEELAGLVRGLFLPEEGEDWCRADYSQEEYRLLVHFAVGMGAEEARQAYRNDRTLNFHRLVLSWFEGMVPDYKTMKNANFAKVYRAGKAKFAETLGMPREETDLIFEAYDTRLPFVGETARLAERRAGQRGFLNLLLDDMRMYFDHWEPADWTLRGIDEYRTYRTREEAEARLPKLLEIAQGKPEHEGQRFRTTVQKADLYKALNRLIQPSGAQLMKNAMLKLDAAGVTGVLGPALVSVHDELDFSVPRTAAGREAFAEAVRCMETSDEGRCRVPIYVETEIGKSWGALAPEGKPNAD